MKILIEISPGELLDRIVILHIKYAELRDPAKTQAIEREIVRLSEAYNSLPQSQALSDLEHALLEENEYIWHAQEELRAKGDSWPSDAQAALGRVIQRHNDERTRIKRAINQLLGSDLQEQKSYLDAQ